MGKKRKTRVPVVNRRALSRREREERYRRWLFVGAGALLALIVAVLGLGAYQVWVASPASPVAIVHGVRIRTDTYQRWVQYQRYELRNSLAWLDQQLRQLDANDPEQESYYSLLLQQRQWLQIQVASVPELTLEELIDDELIRQEAARRGIAVTPEEVQREIEVQFGYHRETPTPEPTADATTDADAAAPAPTAEPMSEARFRELYDETIQALRQNAGFTEADFRMQVSMSLLRRKLEEAMATEVPTTAEQIRARHILVEEEDAARAALERIRNGEDFARVAMEVSIDPGSQEAGGDLGWFPRGQMLSEFDEVAFALQPGEVSDLVETYHGYHVIKVEERDAHRPLDEALLAERRGRVLADWLAEQRASEGVQRRLSSDRVPQDPAPAGW